MDIEEAKKYCKQIKDKDLCKIGYVYGKEAIEKVLAELEIYETNNEILQGELDRIGIDTLKLEEGMSTDDVIEEIKKKDLIINEMVKFIAGLDIDETICKDIEYCIADDEYTNCESCIKEYFTKKVENKGEQEKRYGI